MESEIHTSSIETMAEEAFHWEWDGVFNPTSYPAYGFKARAHLSLGRNPGRGNMYSIPTREDCSGELLDAWIAIPSFSNEMMVSEDNEPNRQAVMSFLNPVFLNLELRGSGLPHVGVHDGIYKCSTEMRWDINEDNEDIHVHDGMFRSKLFLPKHLMTSATVRTTSSGFSFDGSIWAWGNGKNESWLPEHGSREWRFSGEDDGIIVPHVINVSKRYPEWAGPYAQVAVERALELQKNRDSLLSV